MTKGITHIFLGIGLGVFLWVMTGVKGLPLSVSLSSVWE